MAYRTYKKIIRRRKTFRRKTLKNISRQIKKLKPELKFNQQTTTAALTTLVNGTPYVNCVNALGQGTSQTNQRVGDTVRSSFIKVKLNCRATSSLTANSAQQVRVMLVKEKTTLGSDLSLSQLLMSTTPGNPNTWDLINVTNRDHKRFKIYYDKTFLIGNYAGNKEEFNVTFNKRLGFKTNYPRNTTGTVTDIDTNGLFLILITNNTTASAIAFSYSYLYGFYDN